MSDVGGVDVLAALVHGFLGCPQVGHSLMGLMGSASMTVTSPCSVVWQMVRTLVSCATLEPSES
ncbi:hypothetical protein ACQQ6Y_09480 [Corynebacterium diphtheriae]